MKKILLTLCVVSLPLHAAVDFSNNDKRDIYDLMYLPDGGTFFGQTSLSAVATTQNLSVNGDKYSKTTATGTSASQIVGYAFTDRISLSADLDYSFKSTSTTDPETGPNSTSESKGLGDPSVGGKFRLLDQKTDQINLDIIPTYSFSSGPSKSDGDSGDNKAGGSSYSLDVQGGKKFTDLQIFAGIGWSHDNVSTSKDTGTGTKSKSPATDSFNLTLGAQKFIKEKFYFSISGGLMILSPVNENVGGGTKLKTPARAMTMVAGQLGYLLRSNVTVEGSLALASQGDYQAKDSAGNKYNVEDQSTALLNVALKYQF